MYRIQRLSPAPATAAGIGSPSNRRWRRSSRRAKSSTSRAERSSPNSSCIGAPNARSCPRQKQALAAAFRFHTDNVTGHGVRAGNISRYEPCRDDGSPNCCPFQSFALVWASVTPSASSRSYYLRDSDRRLRL